MPLVFVAVKYHMMDYALPVGHVTVRHIRALPSFDLGCSVARDIPTCPRSVAPRAKGDLVL